MFLCDRKLYNILREDSLATIQVCKLCQNSTRYLNCANWFASGTFLASGFLSSHKVCLSEFVRSSDYVNIKLVQRRHLNKFKNSLLKREEKLSKQRILFYSFVKRKAHFLELKMIGKLSSSLFQKRHHYSSNVLIIKFLYLASYKVSCNDKEARGYCFQTAIKIRGREPVNYSSICEVKKPCFWSQPRQSRIKTHLNFIVPFE